MNDDGIGAMLDEREKTHGSFPNVARTAQEIKAALYIGTTYLKLEIPKREALDMIATKLARIVNGHSSEPDHWKDIAGYAMLCCRRDDGG